MAATEKTDPTPIRKGDTIRLHGLDGESWVDVKVADVDRLDDGTVRIAPETTRSEGVEATGAVRPMTVRELVAELAMGPVEDFDIPAREVLARPDLRAALDGPAYRRQ